MGNAEAKSGIDGKDDGEGERHGENESDSGVASECEWENVSKR